MDGEMLDLSNSSCDFLEMLLDWDCTENLAANIVMQNVLVSRIVAENDSIRISIVNSINTGCSGGGG